MQVLRQLIIAIRLAHGAVALTCWTFLIRARVLVRLLGPILVDVSRELRAVQSGRVEFRRRHREGRLRSSAMLRRNIHRLEKGLTMRNRQPVFALDYISETVNLYERTAPWLEESEAIWAKDVLTLYFVTVPSHPSLEMVRSNFGRIKARFGVSSLAAEIAVDSAFSRQFVAQIPYRAEERPALSVNFEALKQLVERRRSIRWFEPEPVQIGLIEQAIDLARQAPSACNRQPYYFKHIADSEQAQKIASIAMGTTGYAGQLPALIVVIGDWSCLAEERDRHIPYIDAALASMQFMLACETLGLGTCPINWPDVEALERRMDSALSLPVFQRPVMLIAVGYPDPEGGVARSTKKPVGDLLH